MRNSSDPSTHQDARRRSLARLARLAPRPLPQVESGIRRAHILMCSEPPFFCQMFRGPGARGDGRDRPLVEGEGRGPCRLRNDLLGIYATCCGNLRCPSSVGAFTGLSLHGYPYTPHLDQVAGTPPASPLGSKRVKPETAEAAEARLRAGW